MEPQSLMAAIPNSASKPMDGSTLVQTRETIWECTGWCCLGIGQPQPFFDSTPDFRKKPATRTEEAEQT